MYTAWFVQFKCFMFYSIVAILYFNSFEPINHCHFHLKFMQHKVTTVDLLSVSSYCSGE